MENPTFSPQERFGIINEMIAQAKQKPRKIDSMHTLLWGYLVLIASITHWSLIQAGHQPIAPAAWSLMLVGMVVSIVMNTKYKDTQKVKTFIDVLIQNIWIAFSIAYLVLVIGLRPDSFYFLPLLMSCYGTATWVHGTVLREQSYKIGAIVCWACGLIAFWVTREQQLLVLAASVVGGYIVPGHLLYTKSQQNHV